MMLASLDTSRSRVWLADWFELKAFIHGSVRFMDHLDDLLDRDSQEEDIDFEEIILEDYQNKVGEEVSRRATWLKDAYPFAMEDGGLTLRFKVGLSPGKRSYLLCLWLSSIISHLLEGDGVKASTEDQRLFQYCATVAAAAFINGKGFSFGFPRPEKGDILKGLDQLHAFGFPEGEPKKTHENWMNTAAKDDEVDVVAWNNANDELPGVLLLYGQVASGANWKTKPLSTNKMKEFCNSWYAVEPTSNPNLAIFIPVCPWPDILEAHGINDYKRRLLNKTCGYGLIFSRYRLPFYVNEHFNNDVGQANLDKTVIRRELLRMHYRLKRALAS